MFIIDPVLVCAFAALVTAISSLVWSLRRRP
jgi:hypothetical protein